MKHFKFSITTCSPLHIGAASDFEPTNYVISDIDNENIKIAPEYIVCDECGYKNLYEKVKEDKICLNCEADLDIPETQTLREKQYFLYTFTPKQLSEAVGRNKLTEMAKKTDNITIMQKFFKDNVSKIVPKAKKLAMVSPVVAGEYEKKFGNLNVKQNDRNMFYIERNIFTSTDNSAYIPASSLKGAIRTAVLSYCNQEVKLTKHSFDKGKKYEPKLMNYNNASDDPFYELKISDMIADKSFLTQIIKAQNVKRAAVQEAKGVPSKMEVIPSNISFIGELNLVERQNHKTELNIEKVRQACNDFYLTRLREEKDNMINVHHISASFFTMLENKAKEPNTFIVCLGKHGGAENVTIDGIRDIKIMLPEKKYEYRNHATTYWFANDGKQTMPFGWCVIKYKED